MPKLAQYKAFIFFMWMYDFGERRHVHIIKNRTGHNNPAKIWLDTLEWAERGSLTEKEMREVERVIIKNMAKLMKQIDLHEQGKKPKKLML